MHQIIIQNASSEKKIPAASQLQKWADKALEKTDDATELTIRIVDIEEMTELNQNYSKKKGPTNVLAFPFETQPEVELDLPVLGDIVICAQVVNDEAKAQKKDEQAHWAHMVVHGTLHLLGYDHQDDEEAAAMEREEINIMKELGFKNPYEDVDNIAHYD